MPTLKLHHEGWISLPSSLRRQFGLGSGARLEADLVGGAIVLRRAAKAGRQPPRDVQEATAVDPPADDDTPEALAPSDATPARRKPGRPRKTAGAGELAPTPAARKARGQPRKAVALAPAPEPVVRPMVGVGPARLVKKADLPPKTAPPEPAPPPADAPGRARGDAGSRFEERRPFRHVEVRKLGPGRGHNRPRGGHARPDPAGPVERR